MSIDEIAVPTQPDRGAASGALAALRAACGGAVHVPGDHGYDAARRPWNVAVDQRPAAVAYPADAAEVAAVVRAVRAAGLRIAAQGTGHNAGPLADLAGTVLLRTSALTELSIDRLERQARVGAGVLWGDVVDAGAEHDLAALHGSSPDVGVAGYSLGGGMGWYARRHGLQTNAVTAIELVTADGTHVRTDAQNDPELFWALRGGGGNFGVVTALEFDLFPITTAYAGWLVWDWTQAAPVLDAWHAWTLDCPDSATTSLRILQLPPIEEVPPPLRGRQIVAIDGAILADDATAKELLAPLRALRPELDTFSRMASVDLGRLHGDPEGPTPAVSDTLMLAELPAEARAAFVAAAGAESGSSLTIAELRQLGGALGRPDPRGGALPCIEGAFALFACAIAPDAAAAERGSADAARLVDAMSAWGAERSYLNFVERPANLRAAYGDATYDRLLAVRRRVDPTGLFLANHEICG